MVKDDVSPEVSPRFNGAKSYMYDFIPFKASFTIKYSKGAAFVETSPKNLVKQRISISEKQNNKKGLTQNKESVPQIIHEIYSICPTWKTIFQSHPHE